MSASKDEGHEPPRITIRRLSHIRKTDKVEDSATEEEEEPEDLFADDDERMEMMQIFRIFDKDGDGSITTKELGTVMHALGQNPTEAELLDIIEEVDKDGNGLLDFYEFASMLKSQQKEVLTDQDLKEAFMLMNRSGSGFITKEEIKIMMENLGQKITDKEIATMISEIDLDGDGMICFDEFRTLMISSK